MRKAVCAVAALLLLLAVSACGDAGVRDVLPVSEPPAGDASVPDGTDEPPRFEPNRALFNADAPDGHSIMADDGRLYCVNARGEVTYSLPCGERNATRLYGGVFLSYDGITARLRRADGSEVAVEGGTDKLDLLFLSGDTCFDYEAFQSGVTEAQRRNIMANELLEDGYILALRASDGGTSPVFELGVLRIDGRWAVPPAADHPLLWALAGDAPDALLSRLTYCREGVFRYDAGGCDVNGDPVVYYYDVSGNTLCRVEREGVDAGRFCGGVALAAGMDGDQRVMYCGLARRRGGQHRPDARLQLRAGNGLCRRAGVCARGDLRLCYGFRRKSAQAAGGVHQRRFLRPADGNAAYPVRAGRRALLLHGA